MPKNEHASSKAAARAKALRNRANRRHQDQPLENLGTAVDPDLAEEVESRVFHRKPAESRAAKDESLGREVLARRRRRSELLAMTSLRRAKAKRSVILELEAEE